MSEHKIFAMPFSKIYSLYIQKVEKKGRTQNEVDEIIFWLTGHDGVSLSEALGGETTLEDFFMSAPRINPNASLIKGVICGCRVEEMEEGTMRNVRYLDKLIDELAKGKAMDKILRK